MREINNRVSKRLQDLTGSNESLIPKNFAQVIEFLLPKHFGKQIGTVIVSSDVPELDLVFLTPNTTCPLHPCI